MRPSDDRPEAAVAPEDLSAADDRALVAAFVAGQREAFDQIVARHQRAIYQLCYRFTRSHEDAADLAQDVFVRAFKALGRFKGDSSLATWLYRIAVNVCLNRAAARRVPTAPIEAAGQMGGDSSDALAELMRRERADVVRRAIDQLPPKQRVAVTLRIYQDCSHQEIAAVLGTTVGAAKANFFHALSRLRRMLTS